MTHFAPHTDTYLQSIRENLYGHKRKLRFILEALEHWQSHSGRAPKVLDVGCGTGAVITHHIARAGYRVKGLDTDKHSIQIANESFSSPMLEFCCGVIAEEKTQYDAVLVVEVLEHLSDPVGFLRQIHQVLAADGVLLLTVPNGFGPYEIESALWKVTRMDALWVRRVAPWLKKLLRPTEDSFASNRREIRNSMDESPHINFFTPRRLNRLLVDAGFELRSVGKSSLIAGPFSDTFLPKFQWLFKLNAELGSLAPAWAVNGHYYQATRRVEQC